MLFIWVFFVTSLLQTSFGAPEAGADALQRQKVAEANCNVEQGSHEPIDIIFIIDGSSSIHQDSFNKQSKYFAKSVVDRLKIGPDQTQVAVVQFRSTQKTEFSLNTYSTKQEITDAMGRIVYLEGVTYTGAAINYTTSTEFTPAKGDRPDKRNVAVVITDGKAQDDVITASRIANRSNITMYAVGVTGMADYIQLLMIAADDPKKIIIFDETNDMAQKNFTDAINELVGMLGGDILQCNGSHTVGPSTETPTPHPVSDATPPLPPLEPILSCKPDKIGVQMQMAELFDGVVYVKGHFDDANCKALHNKSGQVGTIAKLTVDNPNCGMRRERSLNPMGLTVWITVVFMHRPPLLTKRDKAYQLKCFFMEATKPVTFDMRVSMLTTQVPLLESFKMPKCEYTIRAGSINGPIAKVARIGDQVFHRWECTSVVPGESVYQMKVYSCYAKDSKGHQELVIDSTGCIVDPIILQGPIDYAANRLSAYAGSMVFKFADIQEVYFDCQIGLCLNIEDGCADFTPPKCPANRRKRNQITPRLQSVQLTSEMIDVIENLSRLDFYNTTKSVRSYTDPVFFQRLNGRNVCVSAWLIGSTAVFILLCLTVVTATVLLKRKTSDFYDR